jgi:hypothetical protein
MIYAQNINGSCLALIVAATNYYKFSFSCEYINYLDVILNLLSDVFVRFNFMKFVLVVFFFLIFMHVGQVIGVLKVETNIAEVKQIVSNSNVNMMEEDPKKDNEKDKKKKKVKEERTFREKVVLVSSLALLFYAIYKVFENLPK